MTSPRATRLRVRSGSSRRSTCAALGHGAMGRGSRLSGGHDILVAKILEVPGTVGHSLEVRQHHPFGIVELLLEGRVERLHAVALAQFMHAAVDEPRGLDLCLEVGAPLDGAPDVDGNEIKPRSRTSRLKRQIVGMRYPRHSRWLPPVEGARHRTAHVGPMDHRAGERNDLIVKEDRADKPRIVDMRAGPVGIGKREMYHRDASISSGGP